MMSALRHLSLLLVGVVSLLCIATSQNMPPPQGKAFERVEQFKKIRLMEVLNLDEQSALKFFARYNKHEELLRDLRQKQVAAFGRIQGLRKTDAADVEYDKIITDLLSVERQFDDAKAQYVNELKEVLTSKQLAEYLVFEFRFQQNLRDLARDAQQRRQGSPLR
jgi:hypothetical protein